MIEMTHPPNVFQAVLWSETNQPLLRALCLVEDGGIPVNLYYEPENPADGKAVMIVLDSRTLRQMLGASPVFVGAEQREEPALWRLGYIRRDDPGRDALWTRVAERDAPLPASLNWEHHGWRIRVYAPDPDAGDCDILF
ncbi:MAG: hypothetical protein EA420_01810 [Candidatus Competibacteraceae bacterium]|nr:MAG: hypothetical protein EA420_01810 [Candidatus Competibacteraceae bacterium]